ncbi:site-specific integrase [Desulfoprunum benzoelyticum]|uniref:Integrase n=1 Tax=Desulfoprunum benzoelyticum TaxID=1506996 RepID=A0A840UUC9_9BACT|nr:site-specific integrase [Desulfoprunum benzoelyticum]MBB5349295.1 integrase [Desulfoprunum benzoelyticum]MBM9529152.1 site-specific integrase [Desulfoprunum benzoelyticum]
MSEWIKCKTTGIRYRLHTTRKHGVGFDRYYTIRYKIAGKERSEGLGWASEGWTEKKASAVLAELKKNITTGSGPATLEEKRQIERNRRAEEVKQEAAERVANITFAEIFTEHYLPVSKSNKRNQQSWQREEQFFRLWINPVIGEKPMREIAPIHLEKIKRAMTLKEKSPRTVQYCLATIRQVFNHALIHSLYFGSNPAAGKIVKRPVIDNRRTRFLTRDEATALLSELARRSTDVHDMALFSLQTGARAGEIFSLTWSDIDLFQGTALLRDTKSNKNRPLFLTDEVKTMLTRRRTSETKSTDLVFPDKNGNKIVQISDSFNRAIDKLKLNEGLTDRRDKLTFHSLRHTYASMLVQAGVDIYHVKELLGHSSIALTERYSHLSDSSLKQAALTIQNS